MLKIFSKILIFTFIITIFLSVLKVLAENLIQENSVESYVSVLRNQEKILGGEVASPENLEILKNCNDNYRCYLEFFENYNSSTTLQKSFSLLSLLMRDYPEFTPYCHQMTHGMGHSEFEKNNNNLDLSLLEFSKGNFFKNISTCGSGYYHGLVEQAVKGITDKEELAKYFKKTCGESIFKDVDKGDCIHGLGHAVMAQTESVEDSLYVCDQTVGDEYNRFNCYTGIFMQMYISFPVEALISKTETGKNIKYDFPICDSLISDLAKRACYFEQSLGFTSFLENKTDYGQAIKLCQNISDPTLKLACVKNFSIRSFIDVGYTNIEKMCLQNTNTKAERVYCVSSYAHRLALSITGGKKDQVYQKIAFDICKNLKITEISLCRKLILEKDPSLYLVSGKDLNI